MKSAAQNQVASNSASTNGYFFNKNNDRSQRKSQPFFQPKLQINQPGDRYEQEADAMADRVMRMPDSGIGQGAFEASAPTVQRKCAECEKQEQEMQLQRKESDRSSPAYAPPAVHDVLNSSSGRPMDRSTRSFMESRFGQDFGDVKIHDDQKAAESAGAINAKAYTSGNNIVFNNSQYSPDSNSGKRLLAHELTHVVQQKGKSKAGVSASDIQRDPGSPAGGCGVCYGAPKFAGSAAHLIIQKAMKALLGKNAVIAERLVPSPGDEYGRLDIAISTGLESILIGEIKPNNDQGKKDGVRDIEWYSAQLRGLGMEEVIPWVWLPKIAALPFPTLGRGEDCPNFQKIKVSVDPSAPGVILYDCAPDYKELVKRCKCWSSKKKKKDEKGKAKGGAANFGLGLSINSTSVGAGNVGIGVSINSNSASVGTVGVGVVRDSQSAAAGAAGAGSSKGSTGAAAGVAGAGKSENNTGVAAGTAGVGKSENNIGAAAGTAGVGNSKNNTIASAGVSGKGSTEDQTAAQAGKSGKAGSKDPSGGSGADENAKQAKAEASKIEETLKTATPEQRKLLQKMIRKQGGNYPVPNSEWVKDFLQATKDVKDADIDDIVKGTTGDAPGDLATAKARIGDGRGKGDKAGNPQKDAGASGGGGSVPDACRIAGLNDGSKKRIAGASGPVLEVFKSFTAGQKEDQKLTDDVVNKFFSIIPADLTKDEASALIAGMDTSKGKSPGEVIESLKKAVEQVRKGKKATAGSSGAGINADKADHADKVGSAISDGKQADDTNDYAKTMAEIIHKKNWSGIRGYEVIRADGKDIYKSSLHEVLTAVDFEKRTVKSGADAGTYVAAALIEVEVTSTKPMKVKVLRSDPYVYMLEKDSKAKDIRGKYSISDHGVEIGGTFSGDN